MTDLAAQLLAALDRAEETARATAPSGHRWAWVVDRWEDDEDRAVSFGVVSAPGVAGVAEALGLEPGTGEAVAAHIAANDPAHVLRLTTALREVVKLHASEHACPSGNGVGCTDYGGDEDWQHPCPTLAALASVWDVPGVAE